MSNPQKENGNTCIANELLEALYKYHLSGNEWQILLAVIRKTYGWHKKQDAISLTQFQRDTGLTRDSVCEALKKLVGKNLLEVVGKKGLVKEYRFNKNYENWVVGKKGLVGFSAEGSREIGVCSSPKKGHTKETITKETITKETPLTPQRGEGKEVSYMKFLWEEKTQTKIYKDSEENMRDYEYLLAELGEGITEYLEAVRMIRADRYQSRSIQNKLVNFCGLRENLELVEAYMQTKVDEKLIRLNKLLTIPGRKRS